MRMFLFVSEVEEKTAEQSGYAHLYKSSNTTVQCNPYSALLRPDKNINLTWIMLYPVEQTLRGSPTDEVDSYM